VLLLNKQSNKLQSTKQDEQTSTLTSKYQTIKASKQMTNQQIATSKQMSIEMRKNTPLNK
jgi:hypothetical protein